MKITKYRVISQWREMDENNLMKKTDEKVYLGALVQKVK